jgi:hypothetical protein
MKILILNKRVQKKSQDYDIISNKFPFCVHKLKPILQAVGVSLFRDP